MLKKLGFFICLLFLCLKSFSITVTDSTRISLLTCSPGNELYSLFGHSAIRLETKNYDIVFNYGTFDFRTKNFYIKFARGKLLYRLACGNYDRFIEEYKKDGRGVIEQELNLDLLQKRKLVDALLENYKPENKYYHYSFLFDNCSTRIRDIIETNCGEIVYDYSDNQIYRFWDMLDKYLCANKWIQFGIHIVLGTDCDRIVENREQMFLPDFLMMEYSKAKLKNASGKYVKLVKSENEILAYTNKAPEIPFFLKPGFIFSLLCFIVLIYSIYGHRKSKKLIFLDLGIFIIVGLIGWIIFFLGFFTDHEATFPNLNQLWAAPFIIPISIWCLFTKNHKFKKLYFRFCTILIILAIGIWILSPFVLPMNFLPLLCILLIRYIANIKPSINN
ncbi:MAG: DUF4105 domain-containing protein [Marinifilaceae bacterium]|jgi:hypothetical protein|nr:DUF4105 domain-containing protein [Marinifilaceae bacterium]